MRIPAPILEIKSVAGINVPEALMSPGVQARVPWRPGTLQAGISMEPQPHRKGSPQAKPWRQNHGLSVTEGLPPEADWLFGLEEASSLWLVTKQQGLMPKIDPSYPRKLSDDFCIQADARPAGPTAPPPAGPAP